MKTKMTCCAIAALTTLAGAASASDITVSFENLLAPDATAFTPVFFGLDDGSFNLFDPGATASLGLEQVAELGSTGTLTTEFGAASPGGLSATTGGGPIIGGGAQSVNFSVGDPTQNRFLSFATMVVPTNDLFIGTPNAIEVFDAAGNFNGPITITIFGSQVWDAGTEVNNADNGAAFLQGIDGAAGEIEGGNVSLFFNDPSAGDYLDSLIGRTTAPGFDIASTFGEQTAIATITIVPSPAAAAVLPIAGLVAARRRRR
ncbi:MAG: spondin domain-containing protein [Planctomycetota bacterium]